MNQVISFELTFNPPSISVEIFTSSMSTKLINVTLISTSISVCYGCFVFVKFSILPFCLDNCACIEEKKFSKTILFSSDPGPNIFRTILCKIVLALTFKKILFYLTLIGISIVINYCAFTLKVVIFELTLIK